MSSLSRHLPTFAAMHEIVCLKRHCSQHKLRDVLMYVLCRLHGSNKLDVPKEGDRDRVYGSWFHHRLSTNVLPSLR